MLIPSFQIKLGQTVVTGLVCVGKYDGKHPCLTAATSAGKVFLHTPHDKEAAAAADGVPLKFLSINKKITALTAGALRPHTRGEVLLVGTPTALLAYDVEANSDLFFKDVPDGVNALIFGRVPGVERPLAVVGGNCSIQGFDHDGNELFWTVTGDNVSSLSFCDVENDGVNELLVGSEDNEIRIFQKEEIVSEVTESSKIVGLTPLHHGRYGYALANGTIGVYDRTRRVWRAKSKHRVTSIRGFDLDADDVPELCSGWSNGKIEVRNDENGDLIFKSKMDAPVAALVQSDYRVDGHQQILCVSQEGDLWGYLPAETEVARGGLMGSEAEDRGTEELVRRKMEVENELRSLDHTMAQLKAGQRHAGALPRNTRLALSGVPNPEAGHIEFRLSTTTDATIRAVMAFAEDGGVFQDESFVVWPRVPSREVTVPVALPRDLASSVTFHALCGGRGASQFTVYTLQQRLPRFCMYMVVDVTTASRPASYVTFRLRERMERVVMWLQEAFNAQGFDEKPERLDVAFRSLRDGSSLWFTMARENGGTITIATDDMETAANVVQDLCSSLGVEELESTAHFPVEMEALQATLHRVEEHNAVRMRMAAEIADSSNLVKLLVIRAEDARQLGDMKQMRRAYAELFTLNNTLMGEFAKRATNHKQLLESLKVVNSTIQKAARLRNGSAKTRIITACRAAVKKNNLALLFQVIKQGQVAAGEAGIGDRPVFGVRPTS